MNYVPNRRSDGTIQHARAKQPWPKDKLFRILSIDGGGIRGVFPAAYLAEIENRFLDGRSIATCFDMIAGTSTGGIIALALGSDMAATQALRIYAERGQYIFPAASGLGGFRRLLRWLTQPKHNQTVLQDELLKVFGDRLFDSATTRLVIPSFEGRFGEPFLYKTPHHPDYQKDRHRRVSDIALHTTAAPTYYPGVQDGGYVMVDGGLWANNPVMNALVDVLACYDVPRDNIRILTLGTGDTKFTINERSRRGGIGQWAFLKAFAAASRAQSLNALGQAYLLVGKDNVVRIDPPETDRPIALDDVARSVLEFPPLARTMAEASGHRVQQLFLKECVDPFRKCPLS